MTSNDIRKKFLEFFKQNGHTVVPSSSLIPDDPSVLLTTAGMQQFKPYYAELDPTTTIHPSLGLPVGKSACSAQKCFRTSDIDEVGDATHLTMFEMLGNFSFGGYFKKEAIAYAHEFITQVVKLPISYVTIFKGSDVVPKDLESKAIWNALGITDVREEGMEDVFWGPTGSSGPCGPTTEIYCKTSEGKDVEVWNIVFNEFFCSSSRDDLLAGKAELKKLPQPGVDTGMGFERLVTIVQKTASIYDTDSFTEVFGDFLSHQNKKSARIVADHLRSTVFLLADGVTPSNKDRGYVLRRIMRRMIAHAGKIGVNDLAVLNDKIDDVAEYYAETYPELRQNIDTVHTEFDKEGYKFFHMYSAGLKKLFKMINDAENNPATFVDVMAKNIFDLYQSHGFTFDISFDIIDEADFDYDKNELKKKAHELFHQHQETSKAGSSGKFGGHGLILTGEVKAANEEEVVKVTRMHTATHMLHTALRHVLGNEVHQQGSDITPERLRFDFTYPQKMTAEQIAAVETMVNEEIAKDHQVTVVSVPFKDAVADGALAFFKNKYPETVKVYSVGDYSKEICGGPHVTHSLEVGKVKIVKEEAVSAGVRRIRAIIEP